jgi:hypothetical protein
LFTFSLCDKQDWLNPFKIAVGTGFATGHVKQCKNGKALKVVLLNLLKILAGTGHPNTRPFPYKYVFKYIVN